MEILRAEDIGLVACPGPDGTENADMNMPQMDSTEVRLPRVRA